MSELEQLIYEYDQIMIGEGWYGDPVWKILQDIDAQCAAAQPIARAHTISQLVMHMAFWEQVALRRFSGPETPDLAGNFPEPAVWDADEWQKTLEAFRESNREFRHGVSLLDASCLDQKTPGGQHSFRYELVGVMQHHIYHAGQIALLKKACTGPEKQGSA